MQGWSVADATGFFETRDAAALGEVLPANSVDGKDLLQVTQKVLKDDLRISAFGAQKIRALRQAFLQQP